MLACRNDNRQCMSLQPSASETVAFLKSNKLTAEVIPEPGCRNVYRKDETQGCASVA